MSAPSDPVDAARRRLAGLLLGSPLAAAWAAGPAARPAGTVGAPVTAHGATGGSAAGSAPTDTSTGRWVHAFAAYGPPRYGPDFKHFDYVNPDAPKGGTIRLKNPDRLHSFDKFNPWTTRGNAPTSIHTWMVEGLGHLSQDEPMTVYGLLAEAIFVEPDFSAVSFRIRPQARFNNGTPVLAEDVRHSHGMLSSKQASPSYQTLVGAIKVVRVLEERTVRFEFAQPGRDQVFVAATMPVFSRAWGNGKPFDQIITEHPVLSGPYLIDKVAMPRRIEYRRNPDYWGWGLPVRRGHFNFDRVVYRLYADQAISREAFKAGEVDLYRELRGRAWVRQHAGPKWDSGRIVKRTFDTAFGQGLQAHLMNMRRPLFADMRVREAIGLTYDFETLNKLGLFKRGRSQFNNSEFAAVGLPSPAELKLLEPFRSELPPAVFGPAFEPPRTDGDPSGLRRNLLKARALLEQAGWKLDAAGILRNAQGQAFEFEYLAPGDGTNKDWARNLAKLGITLKDRSVDFALYARRLDEYDFDMVGIAIGTFTLPEPATLAALFGSKSADQPGNSNWRGVKSSAADALIDAITRAETLPDLVAAARAFDRVVMWSHWQVPDLYKASENISYWNRFGVPQTQAKYFAAEGIISGFVEWGPWPCWTWWDQAAAAPARAAG